MTACALMASHPTILAITIRPDSPLEQCSELLPVLQTPAITPAYIPPQQTTLSPLVLPFACISYRISVDGFPAQNSGDFLHFQRRRHAGDPRPHAPPRVCVGHRSATSYRACLLLPLRWLSMT